MKNRALTYCQALTPSPCLSIWSLNALSILSLDARLVVDWGIQPAGHELACIAVIGVRC